VTSGSNIIPEEIEPSACRLEEKLAGTLRGEGRPQAHVDAAVHPGTIRHDPGAQEAQVTIMELHAVDIDQQAFPKIMIMDFESRRRLVEELLI
jgi:hypothetical protein